MKKVLLKTKNALDYITSFGGYAPATIARFVRFVTSSTLTLLLDLLILSIMVEYFEIFYLFSAAVAFTISNSANYVINRYWGFSGTKTKLAEGYVLFFIIGTAGLGITLLLMWLFVSYFGIFYFLSRVIVAIIEGSISFTLHYFITFRMHLNEFDSEEMISRV